MDCYAGHGRCPTRFRLLLFSLLIPFPFPLSTLFFFFAPLRRVATHENSCYFTAGRRATPRVASPAAAQTRIRIRSFSLRVPHAYSAGPVPRPPLWCIDQHPHRRDVTRLHHLPHGPDRARRTFRARNRRASQKTITRR